VKAKFLKTLHLLPWLLLILIGAYLRFDDGYEDITRGRALRLADESHLSYEGVTRVIIFRLSGSPDQRSDDLFRIRGYYLQDVEVFGTVTLEGNDLDSFFDSWGLVPQFHSGGMCHEAPYGFRFFRGEKLVHETSICWRCENFVVGDHWPFKSTLRGFDAKSPESKKLLAFCDQRLPYYRPPLKPAEVPTPPPAPGSPH
jgi:hypothetical protein